MLGRAALAMEAAATVVRQTDWSAERSSMIAGPVYMVKKKEAVSNLMMMGTAQVK